MSNNEALATGTDHLHADLDSGVLTLTLNRPEVRNALTAPMLDALARMLDRAERDATVRVVVLRGAGGSFCAGGDLARLRRGDSIFDPASWPARSGSADEPPTRLHNQQVAQRETVIRLHTMGKPTVAVIEGAAVGAGLGLALACDLRYAGSSAILHTGFARLALAGDFGCTWLLRHRAGPSRALELLYLAEPIPADRAERLGLVTDAVADERLPAHVKMVTRRLAAASPDALRVMKEHVARAGTADLATCADVEAEWHVRLLATDAHRQAIEAFTRSRS